MRGRLVRPGSWGRRRPMVILTLQGASPITYRVFAKEDGSFRVSGLEPGVYSLLAISEEGETALVGGCRVRKGAYCDTGDVEMVRAAFLILEGAHRQKPRSLEVGRGDAVVWRGFEEVGMRLEIPLPPGSYEIRIVGEGIRAGNDAVIRKARLAAGRSEVVRLGGDGAK